MRIYLTGSLAVESGATLLGEREFPGRQGRLAFAFLAAERHRPVPRDELAEVLWGEGLPSSWETSLSAIVSNLRKLLSRIGMEGKEALRWEGASYRMALPGDVWVDVEEAANSLDRAEGALRADQPSTAWGFATVASAITRRPFLPGEEGAWIETQRERLRSVYLRALDALAEVWMVRGQPSLAVTVAEEAVALDPLREAAYRRLMRIHQRGGDRGEALRIYERCRTILAEELGVDPSPETEAMYLQILGRE